MGRSDDAARAARELTADLNPEQLEVVQHDRGPLLVGAVAGAGKTKALVQRIAYLCRVRGVDPSRVLAVTFSKKASEEMTDRLEDLLPDAGARVGTFHSLAAQFFREERPEQRRWELDKGDKYRQIVKKAIGYEHLDWKGADLTVVTQFIGLCKSRCAEANTDHARTIAQDFHSRRPCGQRDAELLFDAYSAAEQIRHERQMYTFDDLLLYMWSDLAENPDLRSKWSARWDFVMQDECQDENLVQREIARMLAEPHGNYMVVGDPAQAIYGFRGADPSGILRFAKTWTARVVHMSRNYRSGARIIDAANGVLAAMPAETRLAMQITPERGVAGVVTATVYADQDAEAQALVAQIRERVASGASWRDHVVLYRTNAMSRAVEEQCLSARIPYVVVGGTNFYDRLEIKSLLAYLRVAADRCQFDDVRRSLNSPFRYLGRAFVDRVEAAGEGEGDPRDSVEVDWVRVVEHLAANGGGLQQRQRASVREWSGIVERMRKRIHDLRDLEAASPMDWCGKPHPGRPSALLESLLSETQYVQWITRDEGTESPENSRVSNIRELVRSAERFATVAELLEYVDETMRQAELAKTERGADRVTLMSIHRSKGLEWPCVHVIGVNDKVLPHARSEDQNEERRLAYVAFTRARDELHVSYVGRAAVGSKVTELVPSTFLVEAGLVAPPQGGLAEAWAARTTPSALMERTSDPRRGEDVG